MAKLTKEEAFDGLKKLHVLIKEPAHTSRVALQAETGLRLTDILVLKENGIIVCKGGHNPSWRWTEQDVVPTMEMAERMLKAKVQLWERNRKKKNGQTQPVVEPEVTEAKSKPRVFSGVKSFVKHQISRQYGNEKFIFTIEENGHGWSCDATGKEVMFETVNEDKLRAVGFALLTAADLMKEATE